MLLQCSKSAHFVATYRRNLSNYATAAAAAAAATAAAACPSLALPFPPPSFGNKPTRGRVQATAGWYHDSEAESPTHASVSQDGHFYDGIVANVVKAAAGDVLLHCANIAPSPAHLVNACLQA
ncbi:unnamed protein product [Taenia asiatica]|uniref:Uncharacterized protein n=1 Tax=Taenia asiatica TaxID=60517 RepID=A0A0R3VZ07_TAEAS|nr:unnamed protein product [Taenia asiatica]